jgi:predicted DsbA family dithiol-disulfide isomerase
MAMLAGLAAIALAAGSVDRVHAGDIPWDRVLGADPDDLDEGQKAAAAAIMQEEKVYYGCKDTIAACLTKEPGCKTARRLAGMVMRKVKAGYSADDIAEMIDMRAISMHPFKTHDIDTAGAPSLGGGDPEVKVVAFADFQCPYCRKVVPRLEKIARKLDGVTLYFKHFPVKSHPKSVPAALASLAAQRQGKFWEFHNLCYEDPHNLDPDDLIEKAREVGVEDMDRFRKDMESKSALEKVESDKIEGLKLGVKGTPTVFIDGKEYKGETSYADLKDVILEELDLVG